MLLLLCSVIGVRGFCYLFIMLLFALAVVVSCGWFCMLLHVVGGADVVAAADDWISKKVEREVGRLEINKPFTDITRLSITHLSMLPSCCFVNRILFYTNFSLSMSSEDQGQRCMYQENGGCSRWLCRYEWTFPWHNCLGNDMTVST